MRWRTLIAPSLFVGVAACADILGIDDGIPRGGDSSVEAGPTDAAPDVRDASADVGPDVTFNVLSCGGTQCNFDQGEACCRTGPTSYQCVTSQSACSGTYIPCDRPSQCPATDAGPRTCCTTDVLNEAGTDYVAASVGCKPYSQCLGTPTHYILCGDGDAGADCPPEAGCAPSTSTLPPFLICK
jgi:hypothetical protein